MSYEKKDSRACAKYELTDGKWPTESGGRIPNRWNRKIGETSLLFIWIYRHYQLWPHREPGDKSSDGPEAKRLLLAYKLSS